MRIIAATAFATLLVDQIAKYWIVFGLNLEQRLVIDVLPPLLVFRMGWNTGINFGLFANELDLMRWLLVGLALAVSAWLLLWGPRGLPRPIARVAAGLIVGGAIGNALDRVIHGAVMDFLNMSCCGIQNPYAFNLADVAIFAGAVGLVLFSEPPKPARNKTP